MLVFFHNSEEYREEFTSKEPDRPSFYWFSDKYFSHWPKNYRHKYFYLFVKNPKRDNIQLRARHDGLDFNALWLAYLNYQQQLIKYEHVEPPIIMSFSKIIPDLIAEYQEDTKQLVIIKPSAYKGQSLNSIYERIRFANIPLIREIVPGIVNSLPFVSPMESNGGYIYDDWNPLVTEKMGMWL